MDLNFDQSLSFVKDQTSEAENFKKITIEVFAHCAKETASDFSKRHVWQWGPYVCKMTLLQRAG